jgi:linearmycin/streptolysin S transport system permease protein
VRAALLIARKDIRQRLRDRSAVLVAIVVPLVLASIFGLIFHDVTTGDACDCEFGVVDAPAPLVAALAGSDVITLHREPDAAAARADIEAGRIGAALLFTSDDRVVVIGDADLPITAQIAESVATTYANRAGGDTFAIADISTASRQLDIATFYAAGMTVFFLFFTVQFGVSSILDERRDGTLARMLVAPIHGGAVLVGKLLTSLVLGVVSMVVLALATRFLLGAHWGNPLGVLLLIVAGVIAATSVMALIATLAKTPDQAQSWQAMAALILGMLGGTFFPVAQAGGVIAAASLATPQAWFLRGVEDLAAGDGVGAVAGPVFAMLAFAALMAALALPRVGRLTGR